MLAVDKGMVEEWLSEFKTVPEASIPSYAKNLKDKCSLVSSLYKVIQDPQSELLEPVCHQLFEFYRSGEELLLQFTLQFLPELIWCYLAVSASKDLQSSGCIEALLLGIYNLEIVDKQGHSKVLSFTIPSLSKPSVYHEPSSIGSMALTEGALSQHGLSRVVYSGPHLQREMLTAQNRFEVLTFLLLRYNAALSYMPAVSLQSLCQICSRICVCGYPRQQVRKYKGINSRIPISSEFMVQMLTGIYYALCGWVTWSCESFHLINGFLPLLTGENLLGMAWTIWASEPSNSRATVKTLVIGGSCGMNEGKLKLNPDKMEVLWVGKADDLDEGILPVLEGIALPLQDYNGEWDLARKAMDDVLYRAQLELYPEPLLVANAIKASLPQGAIKSNKEGTKCIQVEITPTASRISRNAVTSMSIRGHRWKRHGNELGIPEDELIEVSEVDEGFYSRAASTTSHSALSNSSNISNKTLLGKSQRRSGGSKAGGKEKEAVGESYKEHLSRKQNQRAMSDNLELLSLKRLTLTSSQSLPKPGSHSLARTSTTLFSKSFEQVSGVVVPNNHSGTEANRFSVCSLQEENLIFGVERIELPISSKQPNQQRPPTISITLSTD